MSGHPARQRQPRPQVAAVAAAGCLVVAAFQTALTLGAPLGAAALGGTISGPLSASLRTPAAGRRPTAPHPPKPPEHTMSCPTATTLDTAAWTAASTPAVPQHVTV